jgi:hypothetical protein
VGKREIRHRQGAEPGEEIERTNAEIAKAESAYDLNKAAELKYGKLPQLTAELEREEKLAETACTKQPICTTA